MLVLVIALVWVIFGFINAEEVARRAGRLSARGENPEDVPPGVVLTYRVMAVLAGALIVYMIIARLI